MAAATRAAAVAIIGSLAVLLAGCGSSDGPSPAPAPGPGPGPPAPSPVIPAGPIECSKALKRGHCTKCYWPGGPLDKGQMTCQNCSAPYQLGTDQQTCSVDCASMPKPSEKPGIPSNPMAYNGIKWPDVCWDSESTHFFAVGDWGGVCNFNDNKCPDGTLPFPMDNRKGAPLQKPIDTEAQVLVAKQMRQKAINLRSQGNEPKFIINVGDNFYPGGVDSHCGDGNPPQGAFEKSQFAQIFEAMYPVEDLGNIEWWSVLGNHDYGGVCYIKGWDQQIFYTWKPQGRWVMPAQYWQRRAQFKTFNVDFFFLDSNILDAEDPSVDPNHNICSQDNNPGKYCSVGKFPPAAGTDAGSCPVTGPTSVDACVQWFRDNWKLQYKWFLDAVKASDADWQIVVSHYPASYNPGKAQDASFLLWPDVARDAGIDLIVAGHKHEQMVVYRQVEGGVDLGDTAWVITGGGGGVTSEYIPTDSGNDDAYGFMDMTISLETLDIVSISHGGVAGNYIERQKTTVYPRSKGTQISEQPAEVLEFV